MSKLLFVTGKWGPSGGIEQVNLDIVRAFENMGWSVDVQADEYAPFDSKLKASTQFYVLIPQIHHQLKRVFRKLFLNPLRRWRFRKLSTDADLVVFTHVHMLHKLKDELRDSRIWLWVHGIEIWGTNARKLQGFGEKVEKVICVSEYTKTHVIKEFPADKCVVVYNAVDSSFFKKIPSNREALKSDVLIVGRIAKGRPKGHDIILDIVEAMESKLSRPLKIAISGDGDDLERIEAKAKQINSTSSINFLGRLSNDDLVQAYSSTKVFCMLSPTGMDENGDWFGEGLGIVALEAQACETPVLVSSQGGALETVISGATGAVVDPDDHEAVCEELCRMLENSARRKSMGECARAHIIQNFSYECFAKNLAAMLK